jgi:hypothetical protein
MGSLRPVPRPAGITRPLARIECILVDEIKPSGPASTCRLFGKRFELWRVRQFLIRIQKGKCNPTNWLSTADLNAIEQTDYRVQNRHSFVMSSLLGCFSLGCYIPRIFAAQRIRESGAAAAPQAAICSQSEALTDK